MSLTLKPTSASQPSSPHLGLDGVIAVESRLSRVDGLRGELVLAGASLTDLATQETWESVATRLFAAADHKAPEPVHPGAARVAAAARLPAAEVALALSDPIAAMRAGLPLILPAEPTRSDFLAALAVMLGAWLQRQRGGTPVAPDQAATQAEDLVRMGLGEVPQLSARARALDRYLVAVIDHGLNASTFAARVVASTQADDLSALTAAMGALSGPLHGGAPGPVLDMLDAIGTPDRAEAWIRAELAAGRRIMGMAHRVYRVRDPRAAVLEDAADDLAAAGIGGSRRDLARAVEAAAVRVLGERHPDRPLRANVELGTAVLLDAIGFPRQAFTALFACSRTAGWLAHAAEQRRTGRLLRPRLRYSGALPSAGASAPSTSSVVGSAG